EYKNNSGTINANLDYRLNDRHRLTLNNVANFYSRKGDEKLEVDDYMNQRPRVNDRNIMGLGLGSEFSPKFSTSVFAKWYSYHASAFLDLSQQQSVENFQTVTKVDSKLGYGLTGTYFVTEGLQLKANYEKTVRLPVSTELFGEVFGFYLANFDLRPESSQNYNLGMNHTLELDGPSVLNTDVNLFYRRTTDYIRLNLTYAQGEGSYENTELVKTPGIDLEMRYSHSDRFIAGLGLSYLESRNHSRGTTHYKALLPNQPNFFGQADLSYYLNDLWLPQGRLGLSYTLQFV